ncbi:MAG: SH3 domain-containing protein [Candidatus Omnitrophica bacterium]|nr:SH3 domain-containing protein [Candidatus Omnitrophota bacterium]
MPRKRIISFFFCLILGLGTLSSFADDSTPFRGKINSEDINIRSDSTVASEVVINLNKGDDVEVVGELYDWYKVRLPKGAPSYVSKGLTEFLDEKTVVVVKENVNVRLGPGESSSILGKTNKGEVLTVEATEGDWLKIKPLNNSFGWVNKMFVTRSFLADKSRLKNSSAEAGGKVLKPPPELAKDEIFLDGVIRPYGKVMSRTATHKLITGDYKIFLLKGDLSALNAVNYRRVRVIGKIIEEKKQKYPVVEVRKLELGD